jgi:hypothetical protein
MMKRMIPLLALAVMFCLFAAPDASASCWRCSSGQQKCVYVYHPAWYNCVWNPSIGFCDMWDECTPYGTKQAVAPLMSEYRVETVEVLDDALAPEEEARSSKLEAAFEQKID